MTILITGGTGTPTPPLPTSVASRRPLPQLEARVGRRHRLADGAEQVDSDLVANTIRSAIDERTISARDRAALHEVDAGESLVDDGQDERHVVPRPISIDSALG